MVNKLLIGVGIVALVAVGSVGVWKLGGNDERRAGALGPIDEPISLAWRGTWASEAKYDVGQVVSYEGASYVAEAANGGEPPNAKEGPWALMAAKGLQGSAGTFNGTFQSPNGKYSLVVADDGIVMQGPPGTIKLRDTGVELMISNDVSVRAGQAFTLDSTGTATLKASGAMKVEGQATTTVKGSILALNCSGRPIAAVGSQVVGAPNTGVGQVVAPGVPNVLTC